MNVSKTLIAFATAAALVGGVAIAQTDPAQPAPNTTGQPGAALGNADGTPSADMNSTTNNTPATTTDSSVDSSAMAAPEPRADRN